MGRKKKTVESNLLPVSTQTALTDEQPRAEESLKKIQSLSMETEADRERAARFLRITRERIEQLETERKSVTGPLNAAVKTINGWFKPVRDPYEQVVEVLRTRLEDRLLEIQNVKDAALKQVQEAGPGAATAEVLAIAHAPETAPVGVTARDVWDFEILYEHQVPLEYWKVDEMAIQASIKVGIREIPGVRIFRKLGLVVR